VNPKDYVDHLSLFSIFTGYEYLPAHRFVMSVLIPYIKFHSFTDQALYVLQMAIVHLVKT
jgi:hypothetical protein